jgi:2'-5' RNA ligase
MEQEPVTNEMEEAPPQEEAPVEPPVDEAAEGKAEEPEAPEAPPQVKTRKFIGFKQGSRPHFIFTKVRDGKHTKRQIAEMLAQKYGLEPKKAAHEVHSTVYRWGTAKYGYGWKFIKDEGGVISFAPGSGGQ